MPVSDVVAIIAAIAAGAATIIAALGKEIRASRRGSETRHGEVQDQLGVIESVAAGTQRTVGQKLTEANARIADLERQLAGLAAKVPAAAVRGRPGE